MSTKNNNLNASASAKCKCGRYITIGEDNNRLIVGYYLCADCHYREYAKPLTSEEYYEQMKR